MALDDYTSGVVEPPEGTADTTPLADERPFWSLEKLKRAYTDYLGMKQDELQEQRNARCYRHGAQWTPAQVEVFNLRKQPVVTYNRIGRKIDAIVGLMEKMKQDPKAFPRNPQQTDEMGAELATASVRYVLESDLRETRMPYAIEAGAVDGIGGVEMMLIRGDKGDVDIGFAIVDQDSFFYDPRSFRADFSDARYMGVAKWLTVEDAQALAPDKMVEVANQSGIGEDMTAGFSGRDERWFNTTADEKKLRVVDLWYRSRGKWNWCMFTGGLKMAEGQAYFFDEKGQEICKYIMYSSFVDHDGDRYGFVRNLRSAQDEINQRRSKGLHELASRRIRAEDGAFPDIEVARREAVRPDGVVIYNKGFEVDFDDQARLQNIEGQFKFLEEAKNEIENFGPSPALIGQGLEYKSGRAINLLQQAGIAELGPFVVSVRNWKLRLYRLIWCAIQRYWQAERWIRVTDDLGAAQLVQINGLGVDEMGLPRMINSIGALDVNFTMDEGPDEVNMMADAYDTLSALATQGANIPPQVLLELAPLHGSMKRKLLAMLSQPDPAAEQAKQLSLASSAADVDKTKSETALNVANISKIQGDGQQALATGIIERQMDAAQRTQDFQLKAAESAMKMQAEREKARLKSAGEFAAISAAADKSAMDMRAAALKHAQSLRHAEEKHQQTLRQGNGQVGG